MKIAIACDHAGFDLKENIRDFLITSGYEIEDFGTSNSTDSVDYPEFAFKAAISIAEGKNNMGILFCGSGIGMAIAANKVRGIRAVQCENIISARLSKEHNNTNILALGGRLTTPMVAREIVKCWIETPFKMERHQKRVDQIKNFEVNNS